MVRHIEIDPELMRRRWRRVWLAAIVAFLLLLLFLALVVVWRMAKVTPALPARIYLDDRINGVAIVRLDTADCGLEPYCVRWLRAKLRPEDATKLLASIQALLYPRIRVFARGGQEGVFDTRVLAVAHIKRFAYLLRRALEPALNRKDIEPVETVDGVGVYPLPAGGWIASTGRAVVASNDLEWTTETMSVQKKAARAMAKGTEPSAAIENLPDFARRCAALDSPHELCGLMLMTPSRRRAVESLIEDILLRQLTAPERRKLQPSVQDCMSDVDVIGAELDVQPSNRAVLEATFEMKTPQGAEAFARKVDEIAKAVARAAARLKTTVAKPVLEGGWKVRVLVHFDDFQAALDVALKG